MVVDISVVSVTEVGVSWQAAMNPSPGAKSASRHDLNDIALGKWLQQSNTIPGLALPVTSTKIGYGQSNPTYFVDDAVYVTSSLARTPPADVDPSSTTSLRT